jgi:hypothetical protein
MQNEDICATLVFDRESYSQNFASVVVGVVSISAASIVAALMYFNPKLMQHPGKLIFLMCICEAISVWSTLMTALGIEKIICYLGVDA